MKCGLPKRQHLLDSNIFPYPSLHIKPVYHIGIYRLGVSETRWPNFFQRAGAEKRREVLIHDGWCESLVAIIFSVLAVTIRKFRQGRQRGKDRLKHLEESMRWTGTGLASLDLLSRRWSWSRRHRQAVSEWWQHSRLHTSLSWLTRSGRPLWSR